MFDSAIRGSMNVVHTYRFLGHSHGALEGFMKVVNSELDEIGCTDGQDCIIEVIAGVMERRSVLPRIAIANEDEIAGDRSQKRSEVFGAEQWRSIGVDAVRTDDCLSGMDRGGDARCRIDGRRKFVRIADHTGRSVGSTDTRTQFTHPSFEGGLDVRCVAACIAFDRHVRGNGIANAVGDELGARNDRRVARVDAAGHDGLERQDNLRPDNERINGHVRPGGVSADFRYVNNKIVFAGHDAPTRVAKLPAGMPGILWTP